MKGIVYILKSKVTNKYYVGSTSNLERRIKDHNFGNTPSTKSMRPWILCFSQEFESLEIARRIERRLKSLKRRDYLSKIIADGVVKLASSGCSSDG